MARWAESWSLATLAPAALAQLGRATLILGRLALAVVLVGCSVGVGSGEATGDIHAPACGIDGPVDLAPTFFVAEAIDSTMEIRIQRGGDGDFFSDGLRIGIADTEELRGLLGSPIVLDGERDSLITMNFYFNETCPLNREDIPVNFLAQSGTITFTSLYAPDIDDQRLIAAHFEGVRAVDPADPDGRYGVFSGSFDFLYNRGRPAQRFP